MRNISLVILCSVASCSIGYAQDLRCEGDISPKDARSNLRISADALLSEQQRDCIKRSLEILGHFINPQDIPVLVKFLEFKVRVINTDPPGFTLHARSPGDEYPAIWVLGRQGEAANPFLLSEILRTDSSSVRQHNAFLAFQQTNGDSPEIAVQLLKERRASLASVQQKLVDQAVQDVLASPMCARSEGRCKAAASKP